MYFVVYLLQTKRNHIVPYKWIRNFNEIFGRFMNYGVNSNHNFETFWTHNTNAFDKNGVPKFDYLTNPTASDSSTFPQEGWYLCRIIRFTLSLEEASAYCQRRRNIFPALYNEERLYEFPDYPFVHRHSLLMGSSAPVVATNTVTLGANIPHAHTALLENRRGNQNVSIYQEPSQEHHQQNHLPRSEQAETLSGSPRGSSTASNSINVTTLQDLVQVPIDHSVAADGSDSHVTHTMQSSPSILSALQSVDQNEVEMSTNSVAGPSNIGSCGPSLLSLRRQSLFSVNSPHIFDHMETPGTTQRRYSVCSETSIKIEPQPVYSAYHGNFRELEQLFNRPKFTTNQQPENPVRGNPQNPQNPRNQSDDSDSSDDCICESDDIPRPLQSTSQGLIKQEDDRISGDKPFINTKNGRIYQIGSRLVEIHIDVVRRLTFWNINKRDDTDSDFPFALATLLSVLGPEEISTHISEDAIDFVMDLLRVRTDASESRMEAAKTLVLSYCQEQQNKKC